MKRKWNHFVKDYLTFTLKERVGLILIVTIILAVIYLPFPKKKVLPIDQSSIQQDLGDLKIYAESSKPYKGRQFDGADDNPEFTAAPSYKMEKPLTGTLFAFDPNTLDAAGWERLGVRERTVQTIMKLVGKGFKFRKPEDIKKIYGLRPGEADRLLPYVRIAEAPVKEQGIGIAKVGGDNFTERPITPRSIAIIDVNEADTSAFITLPGIGSKRAIQIINFREKLGGFYSVSQVSETYSLPDSIFQKIKERLVCKAPRLRMININTADATLLKSHPYLKWNIVNAIIAYRQQHGNYKQTSDLKKINILTDELFDKIEPYLLVAN
jgi:competence protein ComEA